ncbi:MAG: hypothetical protein J5936_00440 [Acholeplasmatales bacterium]|nr:hypothetical protein [Acholeplasmatales bacterium]
MILIMRGSMRHYYHIFGVVLNMGLAGIWWAMAIDESFRAVLFIIRFARGKWIKKNMVTA